MLRLPSFELLHPETPAEAAQIIDSHQGAARVVAGGTDLYPNMKRRHQSAETVVSLAQVAEMRGIHGRAGEEMRVGALSTLTEIVEHPEIRAAYPAFARAAQSISSPLLRNMGTIGGNLCLDTRCTYYNQNEEWRRSINYCMKEEGEVCWVAPSSPRCWAISASDTAPILCSLGAKVRLVGPEGERVLDLPDLYQDDGIAYLTKRPEEILVEVILPAPSGERASFWKLRRRGSIDFAVFTVAPVVWLDDQGVVEKARIYFGAVRSFPSPATDVVDALVGEKLDGEVIAAAAARARKAATPMDNTDFVARWRGTMVVKYTEAALREVAGLEQERMSPNHQ